MTATAHQSSFFSDDELLPFHEVWHYAGERWVLEVKHGGMDYQGKPYLSTLATSNTEGHWSFGGGKDVGTPVMQIVAEMKAQIIHGPYERSRAKMAQELHDALRAKGIEA